MRQKGFAPILIILFILVAIGGVYYIGTKKGKFISIPIQTPTPIATSSSPQIIPTIKPATDPTANWKEYTNQVFAIKLPVQFAYDSRYSTNPSNMHFTWSEPQNATPIKSMDMVFGYMQGDPTLMSCKTNEECYLGYTKSFSVAGYNKISTTINGKMVNGFETSNNVSGVLNYQNFYPISHDGKLFTFDIQMSAPSVEQAKQLVPQVNQILSTFKFTD